jgi:hypothetical protein
MRLPRMTIRSLMVATAIVAGILTVFVQFGPDPVFVITMIFVPATGIGIWQKLGYWGILVETIPSWLFLLALRLWPGGDFFGLSHLIMILAALLLWCATQWVQREALRALIRQLIWGTISFALSELLAVCCVIMYIFVTSPI